MRRQRVFWGWTLALCAAAAVATAATPSRRALPELPRIGRVSALSIDGEIDPGLAAYVQRVLAEHGDGETVLLELNTLGGRLDSGLAIRDALLASRASSICWVKPRAISAGALIALACDVIAVAPGAMMGAATPVQVGLSGAITAVDAKVVSYMRQEMATTAQAHGRRADVAEAMVDADLAVDGLIEKGKLLTLDAKGALDFGIAELEAADEAALWKQVGRDLPRLERPHATAAERFARLLSEPGIAFALMVIGLLGIGFELFHPTGGAALLGGLGCLALFFFGHHVVNLAGWEELAFILVGAALLGVELYLPGNTFFGVIGFALLMTGLSMALVDLSHLPLSVAWEGGMLPAAIASVMGATLVTAGAAALLIRFLPSTRYGQGLVLETALSSPAPVERGIGLAALVGQKGVAVTDLRPMGRVEVINHKAEARLEVGFLRAGSAIRVLRVEGGRVVVREEEEAVAGNGEGAQP